MCRRTRCWRSDRDRVAIEELPRRRRAARRRSSSCRGCQAFVGEPLPPWPQLSLIVVPRERAGLNRGVPASRAEHMARRSDQRGQGPRPGPVPRAPRGLYFILVLSTGEAENESCFWREKISTQVAHLVRRAAARCADRRAGREGSRPPGPDQGALARAPTRPAPSALPRSAFAVPARTALRACAPLAILTVPACSLGRRATAETASAADAGPGGRGCTRARESSRLVLLRRLGGVRGRRRSRVATHP